MPLPEKKESAVRLTARERVLGTLRGWIVDGTLEPGERLSDKELAAWFDVSRTPVREALQTLAEQKLVLVRPSSGTFVAPVDASEMADAYRLMGGLQALALEMAFPTLGPSDLARLRELNAAFREASGAAAHSAFHHAVAELARNAPLTVFTDTLMAQALRGENLFLASDERRAGSFAEHEAVIDALAARELALAQRLMRANWDPSFWESAKNGPSAKAQNCENDENFPMK